MSLEDLAPSRESDRRDSDSDVMGRTGGAGQEAWEVQHVGSPIHDSMWMENISEVAKTLARKTVI